MTAEKTHYIKADIDYRDDSLSKKLAVEDRKLEEDTAQHFEDCHLDYLFAWCNQDNLAFHYGYWDSDKPYEQHQALINKNQLLYDKVDIKPQDRVLDAGCGIGGSSIWMAKNFGNQWSSESCIIRLNTLSLRHVLPCLIFLPRKLL